MVAELLGDAQPETDNYTAQQRVGLRYDTAHSYICSIGMGNSCQQVPCILQSNHNSGQILLNFSIDMNWYYQHGRGAGNFRLCHLFIFTTASEICPSGLKPRYIQLSAASSSLKSSIECSGNRTTNPSVQVVNRTSSFSWSKQTLNLSTNLVKRFFLLNPTFSLSLSLSPYK